MGFFSFDCRICGHPMLSPYAIEDKNAWMNDAVVLTDDGEIHKGEYDGYGRVGNSESFYDGEFYHLHCWKLAGKPTEFTKNSRHSIDQGYFIEEGAHNIDPPKELPERPDPPSPHSVLKHHLKY